MDNSKFIQHKNIELEYFSKGKGSTAVICFHGFGRNAHDFFDLNYPTNIKVISVNLIFHGNSKFGEKHYGQNQILSDNDLSICIEKIIPEEKIKSAYLIGYSLGGKVALSVLASQKISLKGILLFAPDGFKRNPWYWFANQTMVGQSLHQASIKNPWIFNAFLNASRSLKLASRRQNNFAKEQMGTAQKRELVYRIWRTHGKLGPDLKRVANQLEQGVVKMKIILGVYDKIIPSKPIVNWVNKQSKNCEVVLLKSGHVFSKEVLEEQIRNFI